MTCGCFVGVQCLLNAVSAMTDHEIVSALPQCVLDSDSVSKSVWVQLFKTVRLIGKTMSISIASRGPVTLVLDRVKFHFCGDFFYSEDDICVLVTEFY